jgi:hypothetical protein
VPEIALCEQVCLAVPLARRKAEYLWQVALPDPCGFCGRSGCSVDMVKSNKSFGATSSCIRQHPFSYGFAKKYSVAAPSTNIPISCALDTMTPPRKLPPVFWKYSIYSHIQEKHPRYWDEVDGTPCNLEKDFADKIAISAEELQKLGVFIGFTSAPSAQSLLAGKRTLCGDADLGQGSSKRHKT